MALTSEPADGSLMQTDIRIFPSTSFGRNSAFCSSRPHFNSVSAVNRGTV
jgi:hypothetical protein